MAIYLAALVFGAVLLGASLVHGGSKLDAAGHADTHGNTEPEAENAAGHDHDTGGGPLALVLSALFWTFGSAFFGLTGLALESLSLVTAAAVPFVAAGVGVAAGLTATRVLRQLARGTTGALGDARSHVGRTGRLLLPVAPGQRGKIRVRTATGDADFVAELAPGPAHVHLPAGTRAIVTEMRGATALVAPLPPDLAALTQAAPQSDEP